MRETCAICGESKPIDGSCPFCAHLQKKNQKDKSGKLSAIACKEIPTKTAQQQEQRPRKSNDIVKALITILRAIKRLLDAIKVKVLAGLMRQPHQPAIADQVIRDNVPESFEPTKLIDEVSDSQSDDQVIPFGDIQRTEPEERICPFCAETIKTAAIKCRYCGEFLNDAPKTPELANKKAIPHLRTPVAWRRTANRMLDFCRAPRNRIFIKTMAGVILIVVLVSGVRLFFQQVRGERTIHGSAWLTKGTGQSNLLRGLEVSICDVGAGDIMENDGSVKFLRRIYGIGAPYGITNDVDFGLVKAIARAVAPHIIKSVRADADGKYVISDIQQGGAYVYAQFVDATDGAVWLIPVRLKEGENVTLDLDNHNTAVLVHANY